ncbi:MAG: shikimate dehydrogenase [Flavobacteriales bacterium]|nr:shikimate dehydrogenase [Flavobacteriales bacterium]
MARYGLIGRSLGHSRSPELFADLFAREGVSGAHYDLFELEAVEGLPALIAAHPDLRGLNVTIPYKQTVIPFLHALSTEASAVGAVNSIRITGDRWTGHNTDIEGFRALLAPHLRSLIDQGGEVRPRALVLGSGGSSRAVAYALREHGLRFRVVSRSRDRGDLTWDQVDRTVIGVCRLIINTTPLGMWPTVEEVPPLPYASLTERHHLIDLVYNPEETLFLRRGREAGAVVENGLVMLRRQAEAAWRFWGEG